MVEQHDLHEYIEIIQYSLGLWYARMPSPSNTEVNIHRKAPSPLIQTLR